MTVRPGTQGVKDAHQATAVTRRWFAAPSVGHPGYYGRAVLLACAVTVHTSPDDTLPVPPGPKTATAARDVPESPPDGRVSRYILLHRLGLGGMGAVYEAYDPKLNRRIALKLLRPGLVASEEARLRLLREARALARLSHPNVVQVHDVDVAGDDVYVAMELIDGTSLRDFCHDNPALGWRRVLDAYLDAARGLAAAHDKGLVHRDFKPANVLIDENDCVKVLDFGLAAAVAAPSGSDESPVADEDERADSDPNERDVTSSADDWAPAELAPTQPGGRVSDLLLPVAGRILFDARLTVSGVVMGTPAYMAPEQHEGGEVGPMADIYGFCVSLYEGVYGRLPFSVDELDDGEGAQLELLRRKLEHEFHNPEQSAVPEWLRAVLLRGMAAEPEQRWPSMRELIGALESDPAVRRRERLRLLGAGVLLLALAGIAVIGWLRTGAATPVCRGAGQEIAGVWSPEFSQQVRAGFAAAGSVHAGATHARLAEVLDSYSRAWVSMKNSACAATHLRHEQSQPLLDLRMQCLERRKSRLGALVSILANEPSVEVVDMSVQAALSLPDIARCADIDVLTAAFPPPEDRAVRQRVIALDQLLDRAEALEEAGRYQDGLSAAEAVLTTAEELAYPPLSARALFAVARLSDKSSDSSRAERVLRQTFAVAAEAKDDALLAQLWSYLVHLVGVAQARHDEALHLRLSAETALRRAGDDMVRSQLYAHLGRILAAKGSFTEAMALHRESLAIRERVLPPDHPMIAWSLNALGSLHYSMGNPEEAARSYQRSLAIREQALGSMHPLVAASLNNMAVTIADQGQLSRARVIHERALAVREAALGKEHVRVTVSLNNLGLVLQRMGEFERAHSLHERSLATRRRLLGEEHPLVASAEVNVGFDLYAMGRYEQALPHLQRAVQLRIALHGEGHPEVARARNDLALLFLATEQLDSARSLYQQSLQSIEQSLGSEQLTAVDALVGLGLVAARRAEYASARALLQRARTLQQGMGGLEHLDALTVFMALGELHERSGEPVAAVSSWQRALAVAERSESGHLAACQFGLARALWPLAEDRARALALAGQALAFYRNVEHRPLVHDIERWLADHRS